MLLGTVLLGTVLLGTVLLGTVLLGTAAAWVATHARAADRCGAARSAILRSRRIWRWPIPADVSSIDLGDAYPGPERCPPVGGDVLVHLGVQHLTSSYVANVVPAVTLAPDRAITERHARSTPP